MPQLTRFFKQNSMANPYNAKVLDAWERQIMHCWICDQEFREADSIGNWWCAFHGGIYESDEPGNPHSPAQWTCCHKPEGNAKGCVPCDHKAAPHLWTMIDTQIIPRSFALKASLPGRAGVFATDGGLYVVFRYDAELRQKLDPPHIVVAEPKSET